MIEVKNYENIADLFNDIREMDIDKSKFYFDITEYDRIIKNKYYQKLIFVFAHRVSLVSEIIDIPLFWISRGNRYYVLVDMPSNIIDNPDLIKREVYLTYKKVYIGRERYFLFDDLGIKYGEYELLFPLVIVKDITPKLKSIILKNVSFDDKVNMTTTAIYDEIYSSLALDKINQLIKSYISTNSLSEEIEDSTKLLEMKNDELLRYYRIRERIYEVVNLWFKKLNIG